MALFCAAARVQRVRPAGVWVNSRKQPAAVDRSSRESAAKQRSGAVADQPAAVVDSDAETGSRGRSLHGMSARMRLTGRFIAILRQ